LSEAIRERRVEYPRCIQAINNQKFITEAEKETTELGPDELDLRLPPHPLLQTPETVGVRAGRLCEPFVKPATKLGRYVQNTL
jgi:hypothetical protein